MNKKKFILSHLLAAIIALLNINFVFGQWELIQLPENVSAGELYFDSTDVYLGTGDGIYVSHDNCESWEFLGLQNYIIFAILVTSDNQLLVAGKGKLFRYIGNNQWQTLFVNDANIICLKETSTGSIVFTSWGKIYRSTDSGETWNLVLEKYNTELIEAIDENSEGLLFAGSTSFTGDQGGIYRSIDDGETWELIGLEYHFVSSIVINSFDTIFVGTRGHYQYGGGRIFKSLDPMGNTWELIYDNNLIADMEINEYNTLFIGCPSEGYYGGVFSSYDNGNTWIDLSSGLPTRYIEKVFISPDNFLFVVTYATYRLYRFNDPITYSKPKFEQLFKIYPSPTHNLLSIECPMGDDYKIDLIDINGKLIGKYSIVKGGVLLSISLCNFPDGLYFIRIYNSNFNYLQKIIKN